jgi:NADPH:quinone reductase-like Zn-dependent oxidoreductase
MQEHRANQGPYFYSAALNSPLVFYAVAYLPARTGAGGSVNPTPVLMKAILLRGIYVSSRDTFEAMNRALSLHRIEPVVDRVFPLEQIREALTHLQRGAHFGKIVLRLGPTGS